MDEIMLRIDNVSKMYKLGQIGGTTLRDELQRKMAKIKGQEDPTKKIGAKNYNQGETFMALNGVSFEVKKGERVGIIGHNGAGKSTLLKLISRVTAPTEGKIQMNGRVASMLEVGTGFHPELTGRENIYMNGAILGMTKKEIDAKMEDIIEFSEVRQFIDTPVKRYSSGMYVKLAFSVAANLDSEIVIMDEVLAVGDMAFQKKCISKMNEVSKIEGRTILYVSHNMNTIRQLCNRCIVLNKGAIEYIGDVDTAIKHYNSSGISCGESARFKLSDVKRDWLFGQQALIKEIYYVNKSGNATFDEKEPIRIRLQIGSTKEISDVKIVMSFLNADGIKTAALLTSGFNLMLGDNIFEIEIDNTYIYEGSYRLGIELIEIDQNGGYLSYDNCGSDFPIEIRNRKLGGLMWPSQYYGAVCLPIQKIHVIEKW